MSLLHWRRSWYCLILESAPVLPYPTMASYSFSDKSHVAFRTYADSCGSGSDALWPVTAGSMLPLSTNRRGMVGAGTKAGCRYADAEMLLRETSQPAKLRCATQNQEQVPFEAIYPPERSGNGFLIPVRASLIGQSWVLELRFELSL